MPELNVSGQAAKEPHGKESPGVVDKLRARVEAVSTRVNDIVTRLSETYPKAGLLHISEQFEAISKEFTNYTMIESDPFYEPIRRSKSRSDATKGIAREAGKLAEFFETVSKNPKSYNRAKSRIRINALQAQLTNLIRAIPTSPSHS